MPGAIPQQLAEDEPLGALQFGAVAVGGHLVGLVHDHQIPLRRAQAALQILRPGQLIETGDQEVLLSERVAGVRRLHRRPRQHLEAQSEPVRQLVLPLLHQAARSHN